MRKSTHPAVFAAVAALAVVAFGQERNESREEHKIVHFGDLKWTPIITDCHRLSRDAISRLSRET